MKVYFRKNLVRGLSGETVKSYKPLSALEIVSCGIKVIFRRFKVYALPAFIYFLSSLLQSIIDTPTPPNGTTSESITLVQVTSMTTMLSNLNLAGIGGILTIIYPTTAPPSSVPRIISILGTIGAIIFSWILGTLSQGMIIKIAADDLADLKPSLKKSLNRALEVFWPLLITSLMVTVIVLVGALFLIVPGMIFAIWYSLATTTVVLEGRKKSEALNRSKELVSGYGVDIFIIYIVLLIIGFIPVSILLAFLWLGVMTTTSYILITSVVSAFLSLISPTVFTVTYYELLKRKTVVEA